MSGNLIKIVGPITYKLKPDFSNFALQNSEIRLLCDSTLGPITIRLPQIKTLIEGGFGIRFLIDDVSKTSGSNIITLVSSAGDTIENVNNFIINQNGQKLEVYIAGDNSYAILSNGNNTPGSDKYYEINFVSAMSVSVLGSQHLFNRIPNITVYNLTGQIVLSETNINYLNYNISASFNRLQSGKLILT